MLVAADNTSHKVATELADLVQADPLGQQLFGVKTSKVAPQKIATAIEAYLGALLGPALVGGATADLAALQVGKARCSAAVAALYDIGASERSHKAGAKCGKLVSVGDLATHTAQQVR